MPEGPELLYMAEFINNAQERVGPFVDVSMSALATHPTKHPRVTVPFSPFSLQARSRGKELIITIKPAPAAAAPSSKRKKQTQAAVDDAAGSSLEVLVRAGMSGNFLLLEPGEEMPKHAHLRFHSPSGHVLYFQDVRRFGCWRPGGAWGLDDDTRGPCIIQELDDVVQKIQLHLPSRAFARPICELMMNQSFFNGMGNYLRAEILHRAKIHPFSQARAVLMDAVKRQHDGRPGFFSVCEQVLAESVALLRKHGFADDEERTRVFEEWLQCYMKLNKGKDALGRTIWFGSGLRKARAMAADAVAVVKLMQWRW
ncbi:hypothetical protein PTSG_03950 [Salpingoeca rosetta]|uniref:Formamidopyrimidine-DNA glycosylase catalytic domain-containing protein n=1 Tax=Salpingoeca rosetta (strain ATCC 50818 / BSB-021) TaxID=946362 RepID=F2U7C5_SALR5|nr:uncharacterized protein PTSG_03950 [Salpingoeca rosetta]EGD83342.1 hypothetical protein PTSG_03950 [Salpingoeca rosetta]|eukprot:XP_004994846.1 hypothetical protein PTSG_03950 [Salpingoeca rosetta]